MNNWRKKGDKHNQELPRLKPHNYYTKPPLDRNSNWPQSVPAWEKRFVASIGTIPWKEFLEAKEYIHLYDNIIKWDDSAGEEAFKTAKDQFHAKIRGLPCDIKPHNPDLYIDNIDWNAPPDHDPMLDFDSDSVTPDSDSDREPVVIFGDAIPDPYEHYSTGWGDEEETGVCENKIPEGSNNGINYDDYVNNWDVDLGALNSQLVSNENDNKADKDQGWNDDKNNFGGWNDNYYYGNANNGSGRYKNWRFNGNYNNNSNNNNNNGSWRYNGNRRKPVAQAHGSQWVHRVHP